MFGAEKGRMEGLVHHTCRYCFSKVRDLEIKEEGTYK